MELEEAHIILAQHTEKIKALERDISDIKTECTINRIYKGLKKGRLF